MLIVKIFCILFFCQYLLATKVVKPDEIPGDIGQQMQQTMQRQESGRNFYRQAEEAARKDMHEQAIPLYIKSLEYLSSNQHVALFNLALSYQKLDMHHESIASLIQVLEFLPEDKKENVEQVKQVYRLIADRCAIVDKWDCSSLYYDKLARLQDRSDSTVIKNLAKSLLNWGENVTILKAVDVFNFIIGNFPNEIKSDMTFMCEYGIALAKSNHSEAAEVLSICRDLNKNDLHLNLAIGTRLISTSPSEALEHFELVKKDKTWMDRSFASDVIYRLGLTYRALNRFDDETALYQNAVYQWKIFQRTDQRPQYFYRRRDGSSLPPIPWHRPKEILNTHSAQNLQVISSDGGSSILVENEDTDFIMNEVDHVIELLESNFIDIKNEVLIFLNAEKERLQNENNENSTTISYSLPDLEGLVDNGHWNQIPIYRNGKEFAPTWENIFPEYFPILQKVSKDIVNKYSENLPLGAIEISTLSPHTHLRSHCGPTNHKVRFHLGIIVPNENDAYPSIRVSNSTHKWEEGKVIAFDDSFEHEVFNPTSQDRVVLIVDIWHPLISSDSERNRIRSYYNYKVK